MKEVGLGLPYRLWSAPQARIKGYPFARFQSFRHFRRYLNHRTYQVFENSKPSDICLVLIVATCCPEGEGAGHWSLTDAPTEYVTIHFASLCCQTHSRPVLPYSRVCPGPFLTLTGLDIIHRHPGSQNTLSYCCDRIFSSFQLYDPMRNKSSSVISL
jgi:hypothetical protein